MSDEQELTQLLAREPMQAELGMIEKRRQENEPPSSPVSTDIDFSLWQVLPNGRFRPGARTQKTLPAGAYHLASDDRGLYLQHMRILSDDIIELPEACHMRALSGIRKFWKSQDRYRKHGLIYKRGVLLWGPAGGGKTVTAQLLMNEIVRSHDGLVLMCEQPKTCVEAIIAIRMIEPLRQLVVVMEDIDEIVLQYGEHALLALLDGEYQIANVVFVATTNYPERLGARIVNRPSRFDERIKIGMPSAESRRVYLRKTMGDVPLLADLQQWVADTEGLSIAHLRELVVAVVCLEQPYEEVIERLRSMEIRPKEIDGFRHGRIGLSIEKAASEAGSRR